MTIIEQIQKQFRLLKNWSIEHTDDDEYAGQTHINAKEKYACIYPYSRDHKEITPDDYYLHEILHICMYIIMWEKKYRKKWKAEETFIQDLCKMMEEDWWRYNTERRAKCNN